MRNKNNNSDIIQIKKYSNRRLYHSAQKRYINLQQISDLIKSGNTIKVIDTQSKEDITKQILIQTILESEKNKQDMLPVPFLHKLIRYGNKLSNSYLDKSFIMMMQPYLYENSNSDNNDSLKYSKFANTSSSKLKPKNRNDDLLKIKQKMEELEQQIRNISN